MSQHIIQLIRITSRILIRITLFFFASYINQNHKDATLDTILYIDQNVSQACPSGECAFFLLKKLGDLLKQGHFEIAKEKKIQAISICQYPHPQKFFGVLQIYWVLHTGIFILLQTPQKICYLMVSCRKWYFCKKYFQCFEKRYDLVLSILSK